VTPPARPVDISLERSLADLDDEARRDRELDTALLDRELPDSRFADATYLHWLYDRNPLGPAYQDHVDEDGLRVAHYGLVPQEYRDPGGRHPFVFSLNAVTRATGHRKGHFSTLCRLLWDRAAAGGVRAIVGVTNAKSLKPVVRLGWRCIGPMPVQVLLPGVTRPRGWESHLVAGHFLTSATFAEVADGLDESPVERWTNAWTAPYLRWRLASPHGRNPFAVHVDERLVAVSTLHPVGGVPVAVVLKVLPRHGAFGPLPGRELVTEVCRFHGAPAAVYAGWNRHVRLRGLPLPERCKPVPLNLMVHTLDPAIRQETFTLDTYEFLDADAY
jgi:hypothetical protein